MIPSQANSSVIFGRSGATAVFRRMAKAIRRTCLPVAGCLVVLLSAAAQADVPLPPRVLEPLSAQEAWNVIRLATSNVERLLRERRPREIAEQIALCSAPLRLLAVSPVEPDRLPLLDEQTAKAFRAVNLIAREGMADNTEGAEAAFDQLREVLRELAVGFEAEVVNAEIYHCPDHPEVVSTSAAARCDECRRKLAARRIPYSFIYTRQEQPTMTLIAQPESPLEAGREARVRVRLQTLDGAPVLHSDLWIMHTQPIHILVIGPGLADFHHLSPTVTNNAGEFAFSFKPALGGTYQIRAGVVPAATGLQEYPAADLQCAGPAAPPLETTESFASTVDGLRFSITQATGRTGPVQAGQLQMLRIHVADADRQPVKRLEPIMNAFAHLTGFYADNETVLQLHPAGGEILRQDLRGGPFVGFKFYPPKTGFLRLYCQVRVDGRTVTAPLGLLVID